MECVDTTVERDSNVAVSRLVQSAPDGTETIVTESLVDFNRAGCALVEIVFNPDIRSANDAASVLSTLRDTMRYIGTCDGRMEEGSLRCDLNISIAPINGDGAGKHVDGDNPFQESLPPGTGNRVEVKNLNSMKQGECSLLLFMCMMCFSHICSLTYNDSFCGCTV